MGKICCTCGCPRDSKSNLRAWFFHRAIKMAQQHTKRQFLCASTFPDATKPCTTPPGPLSLCSTPSMPRDG
eukprot:1159961-Pelagomonas_calceolata.AAC.8